MSILWGCCCPLTTDDDYQQPLLQGGQSRGISEVPPPRETMSRPHDKEGTGLETSADAAHCHSLEASTLVKVEDQKVQRAHSIGTPSLTNASACSEVQRDTKGGVISEPQLVDAPSSPFPDAKSLSGLDRLTPAECHLTGTSVHSSDIVNRQESDMKEDQIVESTQQDDVVLDPVLKQEIETGDNSGLTGQVNKDARDVGTSQNVLLSAERPSNIEHIKETITTDKQGEACEKKEEVPEDCEVSESSAISAKTAVSEDEYIVVMSPHADVLQTSTSVGNVESLPSAPQQGTGIVNEVVSKITSETSSPAQTLPEPASAINQIAALTAAAVSTAQEPTETSVDTTASASKEPTLKAGSGSHGAIAESSTNASETAKAQGQESTNKGNSKNRNKKGKKGKK